MKKKLICAVDDCKRQATLNKKHGLAAMNCLRHVRDFNNAMKDSLMWGVDNPEAFLKAHAKGTKEGIKYALDILNEEIKEKAL